MKWLDKLAGPVLKPNAMWLFERLIGLWFLVAALVYLPLQEIFWGQESVFALSHGDGLLRNLFFVLAYNRGIDDLFLIVHMISAIWIVFGRYSTLPKFLLYFTGYALYYAAFFVFNGGFILSLILLFFLIFSFPRTRKAWMQVSTNLAMLACVLQVALLYVVAGISKLSGEDWWDGSGFYYALQLRVYAHDWVRALLGDQRWVLIFMSYFAFIYQLVFPFAVWFKKIKYPLLICGVIFHLGIAIMFGLYDFASAMIISYIPFLDEKLVTRFVSKLPKWWRAEDPEMSKAES